MFSSVGRVAAIAIYSLILVLAGSWESTNAHPESVEGCCDVPSDERTVCSAGGKLTEESCLRSKCCFDRSAGDDETTCYRPKQSCVRCAMKVWKRKPCGYWSSGQAMCEGLGCCYDGRMFPYCYSGKTEMVPSPIAPRDDPSGVILGTNKNGRIYWDTAADDKMVFDPNKKEITLLHCPVNNYRTACGPIGIDKAQCSQLGCCWNPALGNPVCFQTVSKAVNNQTQVDAVIRELEKQAQSSSSTSYLEKGGSKEVQVDTHPEQNSSPLTHYNYGNFTVILECPAHVNASGSCQASKRNLCMEQSCCWIDGVCVAGTSRFQQTGETTGTPGHASTISDKPLSDQAFLANYWIRTHVEVIIEDIDMQLMCSTINSSALPCGEKNVTREECVKMRCCWDPEFALHERPESVCSMPALTKREPSTRSKGTDEKSKSSWSNWQTWSDCMPAERGTPLGGKRLRRRDCTSRDAEYTGVQSCSGSATETMDCIDPGGCILGDWSSWTPWSKCSASCSPGMQRRVRRCELEEAADIDPECKDCENEGLPPSYEETDERKCNEMLCPKWVNWKEEECVCGKKISTRNCSDRDVSMEEHDSSCYNVTSDCSGLCLPNWSDWGAWSQCSGSCERGMRFRSRRCSDADDKERTGCGGKSSEAEECNSDLCVEWSDWQIQDDCDALCNETGSQSSKRTCINPSGFVGEENACHTKISSCDGEVCRIDSDTWGSWSSCKEECGPSFMTRTRICIINGVSVDPSRCKRSVKEETKICNHKMCESWAEWRLENDCSAPCRGSGNRTRTRRCLNQNQTAVAEEHSLSCYSLQVPCDGPPTCPPAWSDWESWSSCSESCTVGMRRRKRVCVAENGDEAKDACPGGAEQTEPCNVGSCLQWSKWFTIGECDSECEEDGVQSMERTCIDPSDFFSADISCNAKLELCTGARCMGDWSEWAPWSNCPSSCSPSTTSRTRQCVFKGGATDDLTRCHKTANDSNEQSTACNERMCENWGEWMPQDDCTAPCKGTGIQTLLRSCMDANSGDDTLSDFHDLSCFRTSKQCQGDPVCPPEFGDWSEWTSCSQTCKQGIRSRARNCYSDDGEVADGCDGSYNQTENCNSDLCVEWGAWEVSGDCFAVCEQEGTQLSMRKCLNPTNLEPIASECNTRREPCTGARCLGSWSAWGDWSDCKDPCGPSTTSRSRQCIFQGNATEDISRCLENGSVSKVDIKQCNIELCSLWGSWILEDDCDAPCRDFGNQTRSRPCLDAAIIDVTIAHTPFCYTSQVSCDGLPKCPPAWRPWEEWSSCSSSCQQGSRRRIRTCVDEDGKEVDECPGHPDETQLCNTDLCVTWNDWQLTSQCDADCEESGLQDSQRNCAEPDDFVPTSAECFSRRVPCNGSRCMGEWENWSNWSDCKDPCGPSSMNRVRRCIFRGNATEDFSRCEREEGDSSEEVAPCNEHLCSSWGNWTLGDDCDAPCRGTGNQKRSRPCLEANPQFVLLEDYHEASCYRVEVPCDGEPRCPSAWGGWEEWTSCSEECTQGLKTRTRLCFNDDGESVNECPGLYNETTVCNSELCVLWAPWEDSGPCNASCEEYGFQQTQRSCLEPVDLIASDTSCSTKYVSCLSGRCMGDWGEWGAWSECPDPCGPSQTNRSRSCVFNGETTGDLSRCQMDDEAGDVENEGCNMMMCANWGEWNLQDDCNAPCRGTGNQTEWRTCLDELATDIGELHPTQCYTNTVACLGEPTCPPAWSKWGEWSFCSETCAKGKRTRVRSCEDDFGFLASGCAGGAIDTEDCNDDMCHEWGNWELVEGCEAKCEEEGVQRTERPCLNPSGFIDDGARCGTNFSVCMGSRCMGDWSDWNSWSECQDSCAPSMKNRSRRCLFQGEETDDLTRCFEEGEASDAESATCNEQLCKNWGEWALEGNCNASCRDMGLEMRSRACLDDDSLLSVHQEFCYKELVYCEGAAICPPAWSRWESWSECSETCTIGSRQRNRACLNDSSSVVDARECPGAESETESCNADLCEEWGAWETTGECVANCEEVGAEELWRSCLNPVGLATEDPLCNTSSLPCRGERCLGDWNKWSSWSECSDSCSRSTKKRNRECLFRGEPTVDTTRCHREGIVANVESAPCNEQMCEEWGDWMLEDDCDASCKETGIQTRSRPCLNLNATRLAVVYVNQASCFREQVMCSGSPVCPPAWENWGSWGSCSESCSPGNRIRSRSCFNDTGDIVVGGCDGVATETEDCNLELCQEWSEWEEVGSCSAGCEEDGEQRSDRRCLSPPGFKTTNTKCDSKFIPCIGERCMGAWDDWSPWSSCDSKCEPSVVHRTRKCMFDGGSTDDMTRCRLDEQDSNIDRAECNQFLCKRWGEWQLQNDCDAPCRANGTQTSARQCLDDDFKPEDLSLHDESCYSAPVDCEGSPVCSPSWQEWGSWSQCSESCIIGAQTRLRVCTNDTGSVVDECLGDFEETQGCNVDLCARLSDWETSADCNASCEESGWQNMTRNCLTSPELAVEDKCGAKLVSCDGERCMGAWDSWGAWSDCQDPCGPSLATRRRQCIFRGATTDDVTRCLGSDAETASCNDNTCKTWADWVLMDDCNAPCRGDGLQTRSRLCLDSFLSEPLPDLHRESCFTLRVPCVGEPTCPPAWDEWGPWSSCSHKCTVGERSRRRSCVDDDGGPADSCQGNSTESEICNSNLCLDWGDWFAVGECEAKCEMEGMRRSERICKDPVRFLETNADCNVKRIPCIGPRCMGQWDLWSTWSDCSSSCGPSFMNRTRKCVFEGESTKDLTRCHSLRDTTNLETISCNEFMCRNWGEWRLADDCDAPCRDEGLQTRHRPCLSVEFAEADDLLVHQLSCFSERVKCEGAPICPPSWSAWGNWSVCSESCTKGERIRSRACTDDRGKVVSRCDGEEVETEACNTDLCLAWGEYHLVGECSAPCEQNGTHKAERKCLDPVDFVESNIDCFERSLPCSGRRCTGDWEEWGSWSRCSDICGPSTMSRRRRCLFKGEATDDLTRCQSEGNIANMETSSCNERLCRNWAEWNLLECDAPCRGKGIQNRRRRCLDEAAADLSAHDQTCYSIHIECQGPPTCPPRWGEYGNWSTCSESCSRGMAVRDRPCLSEFGDVLTSGCEGSSTDVKLCNEDLCLEWGDWEITAQCDALCEEDGQEMYVRSCATPGEFVEAQEACNTKFKSCKGDLCKGDWSEWSEWSECQERCGPSNNTRTRDCIVKGEIHEDLSRCYREDDASNATEVRLCNQELCPSWNEWCLKEDCNAPCRGKGLQTRSRNCSVVNVAGDVVYLNLGDHEESCYFTQLPCEGPPTCPPSWNDWGAWSPCSQSCSVGVTSRRRQCTTEFGDVIDDDECEGESVEDARCNDHLCRVWSDWALAVACDGECEEEGLSWTLRTCKNQTVHHQTDPVCYQIKTPCVGPPCPGSWGPWGAWSACGKRCGPSIRNRSRSCFLKGELADKTRCTEGESDEVSPCNVIFCSSWMGWKDGNCTGVCGVKGSLKRERGCLLNQITRVIGSDLKTTFPGMPEDCFATTKVCIPECVPEWSKWSQWSSCSASCSPGSRIRSRECLFNSTTVEPKFCSQAVKKLILSDEFSDDGAVHNAPCNLDLCLTWSQWSGVCSSGCGEPGIMVKRRQCKFGLVGQNVVAVTNNAIAKCSTEQVPCLGKCLTIWSPWSSYSACTRTCGPGRSVSKRYCYSRGKKVDEKLCGNRDNLDPDDESPYIRSRACNTDVCDSWTSWSGLKCSRECGGGGRRHKRRICNGTGEVRPLTKPLTDLSCFNVIEVCGHEPCPAEYTAWLPWTRCSSICGRGTRRRWRSCRGLNGQRVRTSDCSKFGPPSKRERCSLSGCVSWAPWEDGECSASCGGSGTLLRKRECSVEAVPPVENPFERCYNVTRPCRGSCG